MSEEYLYDEQHLFELIAEGDERAFTTVVHFYYPRLLPFIIQITKTREIAEEIMQETFLRLWIKRNELQPDNVGGWLRTVAVNLSFEHLKKIALNGKLVDYLKNNTVDYSLATEENINLKESQTLINKAVSQLSEQQRLVYKLSKEQGMSRKEVAKYMNISENTVKNHLLKATQAIRDFLQAAHRILFFLILIF